jgi:CRISPR-associated protein Csx17
MPEIILEGCTPDTLMSYLKALGILRLVSEQTEPAARAEWRTGAFILTSKLDADALTAFLLESYVPTPIVAPWAGGSGFFAGDKGSKLTVQAIAKSTGPRLAAYRDVIDRVQAILQAEGIKRKPTLEQKPRLLQLYRAQLPDGFIGWMDAVLVLRQEGQAFPPLLGTGGNDGRLDFTQNFMQRLLDLGLATAPGPRVSDWLKNALFGTAISGLKSDAVGQFNPGSAGGPNATQGLEGDSRLNPWNFVLMIEGALLLAGSVTRRLSADAAYGTDKAVFPFTVDVSPVGYSSQADADSTSSRGETWMPLWTRPTTLPALRALFAEGRAEINGKQSRDSVGFARAVAGLGTDRGIHAFVRFGFMKRSGKAHLAIPLGSFRVSPQPEVNLLTELDPWRARLRSACRAKEAPSRYVSVQRRIDETVFDFCHYGGPARLNAVLRALGAAEREIALHQGRVGQKTLQPVPPLSPEWIRACNDGSAEFRLALALASIVGTEKVPDLRCNLEAVEPAGKGGRFTWIPDNPSVVWRSGDLSRNLAAVLERRMLDAARLGGPTTPLEAKISASLSDVTQFLAGEIDDRLLEELLWGLMLINHQRKWEGPQATKDSGRPLPRAYALLKLLFLPAKPEKQALLSKTTGKPVTPEPGILVRLRANELPAACQIASRRLRASGYVPMASDSQNPADFQGSDPARLSAALLIPVWNVEELKKLVLRPSPTQAAQTAAD